MFKPYKVFWENKDVHFNLTILINHFKNYKMLNLDRAFDIIYSIPQFYYQGN